jgi:hypothetical protein
MKLQLKTDILVRLPLRRTRRHRTDHLLLHFHATSMMMPRAPPAVAPSPVLSQNRETLARLALRWSKPPDVNVCPYTIFIRSEVLRRKPTNLLPLSFEAQTKKLLWWFCCPNYQTSGADFEAQTGKPDDPGFEAQPRNPCFLSPRARYRLYTASHDLPIIRPLSTWPVLDYPQSSAPSLLLLPRSSSLPTMLHLSPTHHETNNEVEPLKYPRFKFKPRQVDYLSQIK